MEEYGMYIDGKWVPSVSGEVFETKNPTNGEVLATFPAGHKRRCSQGNRRSGEGIPCSGKKFHHQEGVKSF